MPGIFSKIDSIMKRFYDGKTTTEISPELPPGIVAFGEKMVESVPIALPGRQTTCYIRGKFDTAVRFDDGSYGVVDFKTSATRSHQVGLYSRQLHSYAYALENPAEGKPGLAPVSRLGLLCVEPVEMLPWDESSYAYKAQPTWIECTRDDQTFMAFISEVLAVLDGPQPPEAGPRCTWCKYREAASQILP